MRSSYSAVRRFGLTAIIWIAASSRAVLAQTPDEPDIRALPPFVMIIVDSSGSMEWRPGCPCTTSGCTECEPHCDLPNDALGEPPPAKKDRWTVLLESLTGKFVNFSCVALDRTVANGMTYDLNYSKPYHRPWICPDGSPLCSYPGTPTAPIQVQNGLIDNYNTRIRFGLMTFDGQRTYVGASDLVKASDFSLTLSNGPEGSYSYGGAKVVHYPTCTTDYLIDSGVRSKDAAEGGMISLNSDKCINPPCDQYELNDAIQTSLLNTRTFGGTPTAGALDDLYYHLKNEVTDTMAACRKRYAILITDGYADDDFRLYPFPGCNCKAEGTCPANEDPNAMHCPYPTAETAAYNLKHGVNGDGQQIEQLFVVGMSITDAPARMGLNAIASNGGSIDTDNDGNVAFFADDPATLTASLDQVLGSLSDPISRSVPAFATGLGGAQYQVSAGFQVSNDQPTAGFAPPWLGLIERRRFVCNGTTLDSPTLTDQDRFDVQLNKQTDRSLWTALPSNPAAAHLNNQMSRGDATQVCQTSGCDRVELNTLDKGLFHVLDDVTKKAVVDWMYGNAGSVRATKKLGDIYHSSPTIVGPPVDDPGDPSYSLFRESALISERPLIMYIGSNDGILHAFSMEDYPVVGGTPPTVHAGLTLSGGKELWGFVPPAMLDKLGGQLTAHQMSMDGTPVVKDVFFSKGTGPSATDYHTVLITGMRHGGNAYVALDVTDPVVPKFMWQFADDGFMGYTYGQPEIVQAYYQWPAGQPASVRAMAILPGGAGSKGAGPGCSGVTTPAMKVPASPGTSFTTLPDADTAGVTPFRHRSDVQCWQQSGRALYFVDVETGQLIKRIFDTDTNLSNGTVFPSPLTGSPTAYPDSVSSVATEGFVMDADGVMWRIDFTDSDPHPTDALLGWTVRPFHDLFWDRAPDDDETSYERPILSLDDKRRLVILAGTGDTDNFDKPTVRNKVVSLTELTTSATPTGPADYIAALNWELVPRDNAFQTSELVTGEMSLFQSQLFLASFISIADPSQPCSVGRGRLWSLDYTKRDPNDANPASSAPNSGGVQTYGPTRIAVVDSADNSANSGANLFNVTVAAAEPNLLIQGLGTTQRLTCVQPDTTNLGNYYSPSSMLPIAQQTKPAIWIVAQASSDNASRKRAGSQLGSLEVKVDRPQALSRVMSWAGSIE